MALLAAGGQREEALLASQEAVEIYRGLVTTNRAAYLPGLASALNNHAERLALR